MRLATFGLLAGLAAAVAPQTTPNCTSCAVWNTPQKPFKVYGNTYYVGPHGLSSVLITSPAGHILIDGDIAEAAPLIAANVRALGFRMEDVRLILNSHAHFDHAGGLAELQRMTGAPIALSPWSAAVLTGHDDSKDDPQYGILLPVATVHHVQVLHEGETVHVGKLALTAHFTPGHTPGGTSWTWTSCEGAQCLNVVYADSVSAVSAPGYHYSPAVAASFEQSFAFLDRVPCDILLTPHPEAADLWTRLAARESGVQPDPMIDPGACRALADDARKQLAKRLAEDATTQRGAP